jgi:Kef-type K+ transport system membrane component KefB
LFPLAGDAAVPACRGQAGMLFFMSGHEINVVDFEERHRAVAIGLWYPLPLAVGIGAHLLPQLFGADVVANKFPLALFIGAALANSANPVLARILLDLGLLKDRLGATIMAATVVDDLVSWALLFVVFEQLRSGGESSVVSSGVAAELLVLAGFFALTLVCGWLASRCLAAWHVRRPSRSQAASDFAVSYSLSAAAEHADSCLRPLVRVDHTD